MQANQTLASLIATLPESSGARREYEALTRERDALRYACRGGNAQRDTADLLTFMADRFVSEHSEDGAVDWIRAAYERGRMLRNALATPPEKEEKR